MLELLYSSGLRLAELHGLTVKDIDFNRQLLRITGKEIKPELCLLEPKLNKVWLSG